MRAAIAFFCLTTLGFAVTPIEQAPNSDANYQALRHSALTGEGLTVSNLQLARDAGTFTFRSGAIYFVAPVNGKVTGAVFVGDGSFTLVPPIEAERRNLSILTREPKLVEDFNAAVFRFSDSTEADIRKAAAGKAGASSEAASLLAENADHLRTKLRFNLAARLLQDVLSPEPGGFFAAFIKGKKYSGKMVYVIDPHGVPPLALETFGLYTFTLDLTPEEVALLTYDEKFGIWAAFHLSPEYGSGQALSTQKSAWVDIVSQDLDTTVDKSGRLDGKASTTFTANSNGLRVVMFDLFPSLRVTGVTGLNGEPLNFIQEEKKEDAQFAVVLPKPLAAGERYTITTVYGGKEAVSNEGGGNYFPIARDNWYPANRFGDYAEYHMTFRIPKGMKMVASGTLVREVNEGGQTVSEWKSEVPQAVAGFNFGRMKREEVKLKGDGFLVESYANEDLPNFMRSVKHAVDDTMEGGMNRMHSADETAMGSLSTLPMMKKALAEAQLSVELYSDFFGPAPYKRLAITQQTACGFGQAWPALVYLPLCSYLDTTARHELFRGTVRNEAGLMSYFNVVAPHEVAHQWWGHAVGWASYRDQWMSEGFAHLSASLFLQRYRNPEYLKFWEDQRRLLTDRNKEGWRANDVGAVTMGTRLINARSGNVYSDVVYPKGAYILHMIRMMLWNRRTGDQVFKETMRDFTATFANRPASTEDFKAMLEKHLPPELDFHGDRKLDWFFNQWVYGTALPSYGLEYTFGTNEKGEQVLNFKVTQSGVDEKFLMPVPVYIELNDGRVVKLASAPMVGNQARDFKFPLTGLKDRPKRAMLNYYNDVLASN